VGAVRASAALPFFKIYWLPLDCGRASELAGTWIGTELGERRVGRFDSVPEFNRRFTAIATGKDDGETVRRYLTPEARLGLLGLNFWSLMVGGEGLALLVPDRALVQNRNGTVRFEAATEETLRAARLLGPPGARREERW
jgi:hypothetical protein